MDFNPLLQPREPQQSSQQAGKGHIEQPGKSENIEWQTRPTTPSEYENQLGDAFEKIFAEGIEDVDALVAKLNELSVASPDGIAWTVTSFRTEIARLGY